MTDELKELINKATQDLRMASTASNKKRKPLSIAKGFAVVVTDKNGMQFVRTRVNGHPSVALVCSEATAVIEQISHDIVWFHNEAIAECYGKDTIDLVKMTYRGTKVCPRPPFKANVVPLTFKIG